MPVLWPSEKSGWTAYDPAASSARISTLRLPVCSTSCPGPCPRTSAEGERDLEHPGFLVQGDLGGDALGRHRCAMIQPPDLKQVGHKPFIQWPPPAPWPRTFSWWKTNRRSRS